MAGDEDHDQHHSERLNDVARLKTQVSEPELARLLALEGDEDVLDLGSGTGFYTDRIAALTTGQVYALDMSRGMNDQYRERGLPPNVRLLVGDMTALALSDTPSVGADTLVPASVDLVCTIATWHEISGELDLPGVVRVLRPHGRLIVIDWRRDLDSREGGPPLEIRVTASQVAAAIASHFTVSSVENVGRFMFAVTGRRD